MFDEHQTRNIDSVYYDQEQAFKRANILNKELEDKGYSNVINYDIIDNNEQKMDSEEIKMNNKEIAQKISDLEQQIAELKKATQKQGEQKAWKPNVGEKYWYISENMSAINTFFYNDNFGNSIIKSNNYFPTKERAEEVSNKIRMLLKLEQFHDMFCPDYVPDWSSDDEKKYVVDYNEEEKQWDYDLLFFLIKDAVQVYFDSEETAQKVCDLLNGEDEENDG